MPAADAQRWNARYREREAQDQDPGPPRTFLVENVDVLPRCGWALDAAMGRGAAAGFLLQRGLNVIGVDISTVAVNAARRTWPRLNAVVADLTAFGLRDASLDVIVNFYYLERSLWPQYRRMLKPGGVLVIESLSLEMLTVNPDVDPAYLLDAGELEQAFGDWEILARRAGWHTDTGHGSRATRGLVVRRPL